MDAIIKFFAPILSFLLIIGMFTGLVNPPVADFVPKDITFPADTREKMTIIDSGASDYVIVVGENAVPAEAMAAQKLQGFLKQISGFELPIITDDQASSALNEIIIGDTNRYAMDAEKFESLGNDGFVIRTNADGKYGDINEGDIVLMGGQPRGTLYSVYDFLEKFLGCRWFSIEMTIIPENDVVGVPVDIDEIEIPYFTYRQPTLVWRLTSADVDYSLANRVNAQGMIGNATWPEEYGGVVYYPVTHSALTILPPSKYIAEHPEYFAKNADGSPMECEHGENNPCLTNPDVLEIYKEYALNIMNNNPGTQGISMGLNDSGTICQCVDCRALYAQEENPLAGQSRALMEVLNAVCEYLVDMGHTKVTINAFAYGTATYPPSIDLHPNIVIHFCPINMCYIHKAGECDYWENIYYFEEVLEGWSKIAKKITVFEYPLSYNEPGIPYPIWTALQTYMQYYYENNVIGLSCCVATIHDVNFYVMSQYLYAKLLWNPYIDLEEVYQDFLPKYYGGGWQYLREYIRAASEEYGGRTIGGVTYHGNSLDGASVTGNFFLTKNEIKYVEGLWAKAKELAGGAKQLENVRRAELSFRIWKSDNFRGEFWPLKIPTSIRMDANKQLYDDIWELGVTWHNQADYLPTPDEFYDLQLYLLFPKYWSWRQLGRDNQGNVDSFLELLIGVLK
ncbi:MAG: DUF4838 domain-containing protein [Oscillospiraceae bacterium]|nr:DUF4838 domain-containing protein [Oscillospiraceae bacterium]